MSVLFPFLCNLDIPQKQADSEHQSTNQLTKQITLFLK